MLACLSMTMCLFYVQQSTPNMNSVYFVCGIIPCFITIIILDRKPREHFQIPVVYLKVIEELGLNIQHDCAMISMHAFRFSNLYQLHLHNETCVALTNLQWNVCNNRIEIRPYLDLVMLIKSACVVDFLTGTTCPPNGVQY